MADAVSINVDDRDFTRAIRELAEASRRTSAEVVQQQSKLLIRDIIKFQAPTSGPKGKANVKRDILRVFRTPKSGEALAEFLVGNKPDAMKYCDNIRDGSMRLRLQTLIFRGITPQKLANVLFDMRLVHGRSSSYAEANQPVPAIHKAARYKGSVPHNTGKWVYYTGKRSELNAYIRRVQARVGSGEAGWGKAAMRLGVALPAYVLARATSEGGVAIIENKATGYYEIQIWNTNEGAVNQNHERGFVSRAVNIRYDNMISVTDRILTRRLGAVR